MTHPVRRRTVLSLLAGRSAFRLTQVFSTVALLPIWGTEQHGRYAAATASFWWLTALVFSGPEKTLLKLLPRGRRTGQLIAEAMLAALWVVCLLPVAVYLAVLAVTGTRGAWPIYLGAAILLLTNGCTLLILGLYRVTGRPAADPIAFLTLSIGLLLALAAAASGRLEPAGYFTVLVVIQAGLNIVLLIRAGRPSLRLARRRRYLARLAWTTVLMGGTDLAVYLSSGVLFALLAASDRADQVARLFVVEVVWSAGVNVLVYLLRIYAPGTSVRLAGAAAAHAGRRTAARIAAATAAFNVVWLVAVVVVITATDVTGATSAAGQFMLWTVLFASRSPALIALIWAGYLIENTDARAPRITGLSAGLGLAAATVTGVAAIPALGGIGVVVGFAVAELVQAAVMAAGARSGRSPTSADDGVLVEDQQPPPVHGGEGEPEEVIPVDRPALVVDVGVVHVEQYRGGAFDNGADNRLERD
jgi:hypothetical protein